MKTEILLEPTSNKLMVASNTLIDFQIKFSISIGETVTHWFTLIALSALRRSDNENMLSLMNLILRSILTDLQVTPTKPGRMTKPYSSHRFIANCFNAGNFKMEVKQANWAIGRPKAKISPMLEEEKTSRRSKVYNWETATYGKIWRNEDVRDLRSIESEFLAIVYNNTLTSEVTLSCKNDNDKVYMPLFSSLEPTVSYFDDLDFFKDFVDEFPAIVYNDALTSKLDFLTEPSNNDDDKIDMIQSLEGNVMNTDDGAYAQRLSIRRIQTPWIWRIDLLDVIQSLFFSTVDTAYSLNEYSVCDTGHTMSDDLSNKLISEIFERLPPKSLMRFRSLSKSWCSHIQSTDFISRHALRSRKKTPKILIRHAFFDVKEDKRILVYVDGKPKLWKREDDRYTLHSEDQFVSSNPEWLDLSIPAVNFPRNMSDTAMGDTYIGDIVGSCNGIMCLYYHFNRTISLWNPSIRRVTTLPPTPDHSGRGAILVGIGFDQSIDDYKIVWISQKKSFVYTLKTAAWCPIASPSTE
nr:hypothetical protein [Tanacetum cinerariifolium]